MAAGLLAVVGLAVAADEARSAKIFKFKPLTGVPFRNDQGEDVGKLHDLVVTPDGQIVYGVLSFGGVAGVGDKLFAVPPAALATIDEVPGQPGKPQFKVHVRRAQLEATAGFNEKDYPTGPSPVFIGGSDTAPKPVAEKDMKLWRLSKLTGTAVTNAAGESLGKVSEFIVDLKDGRVRTAVIDYGGALGVGNKHFAAPWKALELKAVTGDPSKQSFVANVSKQTLDSQPGFDARGFPTEADLRLFERK
jgi:sporulation protein YlmC with PRC-barrel domain